MKFISFFPIICLLQIGYGQVSGTDHMIFQSVIFDGNNQLLINDSVGLQLSIVRDSMNGSPVYTERHHSISDASGLVTLEIGNGDIQTGHYDSINWSTGPYFLKTEVDVEGGTNYNFLSFSQFLSVPFSLHAKTVEKESDPVFRQSPAFKINAADTAKWSNKQNKLIAGENISISGNTISAFAQNKLDAIDLYVGQDTLGGIIYHIYFDSLQNPHGFIFIMTDTSLEWQLSDSLVYAYLSWDGKYNTAKMANSPLKNYLNALNGSNLGGYNDWYIPSIDEARLLFLNKMELRKNQDEMNLPFNVNPKQAFSIWTSSEINAGSAVNFSFDNGGGGLGKKNKKFRLMVIRSF